MLKKGLLPGRGRNLRGLKVCMHPWVVTCAASFMKGERLKSRVGCLNCVSATVIQLYICILSPGPLLTTHWSLFQPCLFLSFGKCLGTHHRGIAAPVTFLSWLCESQNLPAVTYSPSWLWHGPALLPGPVTHLQWSETWPEPVKGDCEFASVLSQVMVWICKIFSH